MEQFEVNMPFGVHIPDELDDYVFPFIGDNNAITHANTKESDDNNEPQTMVNDVDIDNGFKWAETHEVRGAWC